MRSIGIVIGVALLMLAVSSAAWLLRERPTVKVIPAAGAAPAGVASGAPPALARAAAMADAARDTGGPLRVAVTVPALAGLVRPLLPPGAELTMLMQPGRSEHGYEFTPTELAALGRSHVAVLVGLGLEPAVEKFIARQADGPRRVVNLGEALGIRGVSVCTDPSHTHGHADDHTHAHDPDANSADLPLVDAHLWLDPVLVAQSVPSLRAAVEGAMETRGLLTPEARSALDAAEADLLARVNAVDAAYRERLAPLAGRAIVTHHAAFGRVADRYGLRVAEVIRPIESAEPTPGQLAGVVEAIRRENVRGIFVEPQFDPSSARRIAAAAGVRLGVLDPLGDGDWFALMARNLDALVDTLKDP